MCDCSYTMSGKIMDAKSPEFISFVLNFYRVPGGQGFIALNDFCNSKKGYFASESEDFFTAPREGDSFSLQLQKLDDEQKNLQHQGLSLVLAFAETEEEAKKEAEAMVAFMAGVHAYRAKKEEFIKKLEPVYREFLQELKERTGYWKNLEAICAELNRDGHLDIILKNLEFIYHDSS